VLDVNQQGASPRSLQKELWLAFPAWAAMIVELFGVFFSSGGRHAVNLGRMWAPVTLFTVAAAYASPFLAGKGFKDAIRDRARLSWQMLLFLAISFLVGLVNFSLVSHLNWEAGYK
jgi:hypothetical protein